MTPRFRPSAVEIHLERLVLNGVDEAVAPAVAAAATAELERLLAGAAPPFLEWRGVEDLKVSLAPEVRAASPSLGRELGAAIYRALVQARATGL